MLSLSVHLKVQFKKRYDVKPSGKFMKKKSILFLLGCLLLNHHILRAQSFEEALEKFRTAYIREMFESSRPPMQKEDTRYLSYFPPRQQFRVTGNVSPLHNSDPFLMPAYSGPGQNYIKYALVTFEMNGHSHTLTLYRNLDLIRIPRYKDYLFLPFTDESNIDHTYGGGRYLDLSIKDIKDHTIILDFNRSYNPYCAYSEGYSCPIPPAENDLKIAVNAGERRFTKPK